jgi:tetratricopeptide (TPR) repeat protein
MKFRNLALAAAGLLLLAFTSLAQITTIEGVVKGTDGKPVQNAVVKIDRTDIKGNYKTKTDKKGHYFHTGLPIGFYNISVLIDNREVDKVGNVKTSPGESRMVDFDLQRSAAANAQQQAAMQKAMETGQISKEMERSMTAEQKAALEKTMKEREGQIKQRAALNEAFNTGLTALQGKQYDVAVENLTKASQLDATQPAVWAHLGDAYMGLASTKTGADFDATAQKGLEAYAKSIELKPDDAAAHNNYALALAKAKKFPEMQGELKKAAELDPPNAGKYYYNLGALLVNNGQNDAAVDAFKQAIALQPTYADAYYQYGISLVSKAQIGTDGKVTPVAGTVEAFQKYLELAPTGQFAESAKDMLNTMNASVSTGFKNPAAPKSTKKKK